MNILKKFWHSIATQFIPLKLCASVKNKIKTFVERFERKPLNLDFNMKDYFSLENRIKENRQYLREIQDKYEKIRNYYPLFFIYIGFMGVYTFDILQYFLSNEITSAMFVLGTLLTGHIALFAYVFYLFTQILILKNLRVEAFPNTVYSDYIKNKTEDKSENKKLYKEELEMYLCGLEEDVEYNFGILESKKINLSKIIKFSIISFILYISLISTYKIMTMENEKNLDEASKRKPIKVLLDHEEKQGDLISDSIPTEKEILNEEENPELKKMKKHINYKPGNK